MTATPVTLQKSASDTAPASGTVTVSLGPADSSGPATWDIDSILYKTSRPGLAPVPRVQIMWGTPADGQSVIFDYDGSFGQAAGTLQIVRGQSVYATWTGAQEGDVCTLIVTGTQQ